MAALVQTLSPHTVATSSILARPDSSERYASGSMHHHHNSRYNQKHANTGYRGLPSTGPVAPYAFTSTPQLGFSAGQRSSQAPQLPQLNLGGSSLGNRASSASVPTSPSLNQIQPPKKSMDDTSAQGSKSTPDRYRRNSRRFDVSENISNKPSGVGQLYYHPGQSSSTPTLNSYSSYKNTSYNAPGTKVRTTAIDDMQIGRAQNPDLASRYRRRSLGNIETAGLIHASGDATDTSSPHPNTVIQPINGDYLTVKHVQQPQSSQVHKLSQERQKSHKHSTSADSLSSSKSGKSSRPSSARNDSMTSNSQHATSANKPEVRVVNVPSRHPEQSRRNPSSISNPSPLSKAVNDEDEVTTAPRVAAVPSPAAEHLASLNNKEARKTKSKLRRAFSFGSSAELRKATAQANLEKSNHANNASKRLSKHEETLDPESAKVAAKQEAAGLGESIYSGQGTFFTGSTDNLSISSTASSASLMLRKMGKGMKKGGRSLVGLFRPKSVVGVPAADGPVNEAAAAQVSLVTVEAEREKVNVNLDPHDHQGGGTGFPKLGRNSLDNKASMDSGSVSTDTRSRQSIVGGERERAEVLSAVKKGILKRTDSNQSSPRVRPTDGRNTDLSLPHIPHVNDSPRSSAPSTPRDDNPHNGHRRTDSVTINDHHDDYFSSVDRFASLDSKTGAPATPRNISFSPRIQFHDTWPSGEYDRRGEIATCNRLTPMLAQQIKEELNTFKMEMEVHESSKVYTHFF